MRENVAITDSIRPNMLIIDTLLRDCKEKEASPFSTARRGFQIVSDQSFSPRQHPVYIISCLAEPSISVNWPHPEERRTPHILMTGVFAPWSKTLQLGLATGLAFCSAQAPGNGSAASFHGLFFCFKVFIYQD